MLRAQHLINTGHTKRASQTLHSTSTMADLTQLSVREAMQRLHPPLPAGSVLPATACRCTSRSSSRTTMR